MALSVVHALLLVSAASASALQDASRSPELLLDKMAIDYGEVFAGEELSPAFRVRNAGQAILQLSETPLLPVKQAASSLVAPRAFASSFASARLASPT